MTMPPEEIVQLDFRGLQCPQPIIKTAKEARKLKARRGRLVIVSDDDSFPMDLKSWIKGTDAQLASLEVSGKNHVAHVIINPNATNVPVQQSTSNVVKPSNLEVLDFRGMQCPQPIIALAKKVRTIEPGVSIKVMADDDSFPMDLQSWLKSSNYALDTLEDVDGNFVAILRDQAKTAPKKQTPKATQVVHPAKPTTKHVEKSQTSNASTLKIDLTNKTQTQITQRLAALDLLELEANTPVQLIINDLDAVHYVTQWSSQNQHHITQMDTRTKPITIEVELGDGTSQSSSTALVTTQKKTQQCTLLVLHNDFESLLAAFMVGNGAAAKGMDVVMFFTFWGVNVLRGDKPNLNEKKEKTSLAQRLFKWMMPKGTKQGLGKLNFGGFGSMMMGNIMTQKNVMSMQQMIDAAVELEIRFIVCTMSMSVMGITKRDLVALPNMEYAGVASFVQEAANSEMSMMF